MTWEEWVKTYEDAEEPLSAEMEDWTEDRKALIAERDEAEGALAVAEREIEKTRAERDEWKRKYAEEEEAYTGAMNSCDDMDESRDEWKRRAEKVAEIAMFWVATNCGPKLKVDIDAIMEGRDVKTGNVGNVYGTYGTTEEKITAEKPAPHTREWWEENPQLKWQGLERAVISDWAASDAVKDAEIARYKAERDEAMKALGIIGERKDRYKAALEKMEKQAIYHLRALTFSGAWKAERCAEIDAIVKEAGK